jgi:hypothetical protein
MHHLGCHGSCLVFRVGQNRIYTLYMTVYLVIPLPKILYIHRIYMVLANPTSILCRGSFLSTPLPWILSKQRM